MDLPLNIFIEHETKSIVYNNTTNSMYIRYKYNTIRDIVLKQLGISINPGDDVYKMFKNGLVNKNVYEEKFDLVSKRV